MTLRLARIVDSVRVAELHKSGIHGGFLTSLGVSFLNLLYQSIIESSNAFCIVAEDNGEVVGFIAGVVNLDEFYKEFLQKNIFKAGLILFFNSFKPAVIRKIFEALFYATAKTSSLPKAELLSIAITDNYRGKGVGQGLFERLAGELRNRGVKEFKCLVGSNLLPACKFYEKTGGVFHSETEVHKGEKSRIYLWRI